MDLPGCSKPNRDRKKNKVKKPTRSFKLKPQSTRKKKMAKGKKRNMTATGNLPKKNKNVTPKDDQVPGPSAASPPAENTQQNTDFFESPAHSSTCGTELLPITTDSVENGRRAMEWLVAPHNLDDFLSQVWEKNPIHIARNNPGYYKEILTTLVIDELLRRENLQFPTDVEAISYIDDKRILCEPAGRAYANKVWDNYLCGYTIELLNPQLHIPKLHLLNATLQEFFKSYVGANAYLTPPDSKPCGLHYDGFESFVLQTEGKKHWKIYEPINNKYVLPRVSSKNYKLNEIGEPILEVTLEAGDMLYIPRGFIHQGTAVDREHSLHLTINMHQQHSWADLFVKLLPAALQIAIKENVELRRGLPFNIADHFGLVHSSSNSPQRDQIKDIVESLFDKIKKHLPIDLAVDAMNRVYQAEALPPVLSDLEKSVTAFGKSNFAVRNGKVTNVVKLSLTTKIRLIRKNILRMVSEKKIRLFYYAENFLEYRGIQLPYIEVDEVYAPAVETLIKAYPEYVAVQKLKTPYNVDKMRIADSLWSKGLIMTDYPLKPNPVE